MFDLINGLPLHPLVVHAVVVLLPVAVLGTIAIALRPGWRLRYGHLVVGCAVIATALVPVATSSGESLEHRVGDPGRHAALGDQLIWFALPLVLTSLALVWMARREGSGPTESGETAAVRSRTAIRAVAVLALVAAVATGVQVYRVGDSGARAAWGDQVSATG